MESRAGDMTAVICGVATAFGTPVPIPDLPGHAVPANVAAELVRRGQWLCPVASEGPLVAGAIQESLTSSGMAPGEIVHVLLATENLVIAGDRRAHEDARAKLYPLLAGLGLGHAPFTALTFGGCSSVLTALEYATLLAERDPTRSCHRPSPSSATGWRAVWSPPVPARTRRSRCTGSSDARSWVPPPRM